LSAPSFHRLFARLIQLAGVLAYAELRAAAIDVEIAHVTVPICGLEHLRAIKRAAGRPRDLVDLQHLDAAQPPQAKS
jgi:hypothetical protein